MIRQRPLMVGSRQTKQVVSSLLLMRRPVLCRGVTTRVLRLLSKR